MSIRTESEMADMRDVMKEESIKFSKYLNLEERIEKDDLQISNMGDWEKER